MSADAFLCPVCALPNSGHTGKAWDDHAIAWLADPDRTPTDILGWSAGAARAINGISSSGLEDGPGRAGAMLIRTHRILLTAWKRRRRQGLDQ